MWTAPLALKRATMPYVLTLPVSWGDSKADLFVKRGCSKTLFRSDAKSSSGIDSSVTFSTSKASGEHGLKRFTDRRGSKNFHSAYAGRNITTQNLRTGLLEAFLRLR
eukprot:CAMPEP_0114264440 /NCGR_PEP_ID=MMETSP0058-20121206/23205_1 /TAXON_ID=36894 /ORGANISM="Pyramimonas parkeae, CCMP726" /LENGTH=106 /DNA_ID=CAMNT_0001381109 /DNA_START=503 /DNA_END=823 /DNA_ORIENTATION=+